MNLVFLHGGPGFKDYLEPYFQELKPEYNCVFYDQLQGPKVDINDLTQQLGEIISHLDGNTILVAHSWGCVLGTRYIETETAVSGLVNICAPLNSTHWNEEYEKAIRELGLENPTNEQIFLSEQDKVEGCILLDKAFETFSQETFDSFQHFINNYDLIPTLINTDVPIANIFSEKDVRISSKPHHKIREINQRLTNFEIKGAAHFPFLIESERVRVHKIIRNFIKKLGL